MPSYEYNCNKCKKVFTVYLTIKEVDGNPQIRCEHCKSTNVVKKVTSFFAKTSKKS
jgi:putative FmdB family regulatory protein